MRKIQPVVNVVLAVTLVLTALSGGAVAQQGPPEGYAEDLLDMFRDNRAAFNEAIVDVDLGPAGPRLAGKTTNVVITDESDVPVVWFSMDDQNRITDEGLGANDDADLVMRTTNETIVAVLTDDNPARAFRDAYARDDIEIVPAYSLVGALTSGRVIDWIFWNVAELLKGVLF